MRLPQPRKAKTLVVGTRLVREHNGEQHQVTVLASGFDYRGQRYKSLSAIARSITGTQWSGPLFFGLKQGGGKACNSGMTATSTRRRGKLYRYYTPNNHIKKSCMDCPIGSISAGEIESIVLQQLRPILKTPETLALLTSEARKTNPTTTEADVAHALSNLAEIWEHVFPVEQERLMQRLIKRITVHPNRVDIDIQPEGVTVLVSILPITAENKEAD